MSIFGDSIDIYSFLVLPWYDSYE